MGTRAPSRSDGRLLARIRDKHLVPAVWAAHARKAFLQISALEKGFHGMLNDRPPEAVLGLKTLIVDLLECLKMRIDQTPQVRVPRIAWKIHGGRFDTRQSHEKNATSGCTVGNRRAHSLPIHG